MRTFLSRQLHLSSSIPPGNLYDGDSDGRCVIEADCESQKCACIFIARMRVLPDAFRSVELTPFRLR